MVIKQKLQVTIFSAYQVRSQINNICTGADIQLARSNRGHLIFSKNFHDTAISIWRVYDSQ